MTTSITAQDTENSNIELKNLIELNNSTTSVLSNSDVSFSNLINNVSTKTESVKTDFIDKVAKSNTSCVNKKAFNAQEENKTVKFSSSLKDDVKASIKNSNSQSKVKNNISNNTDTKITNTTKSSKETQINNTINTSSINKTNIADNSKTDTSSKKDNSIDKNILDINNSSFVESSPAFSSSGDNIDSDSSEEAVDLIEENQDLVSLTATLSYQDNSNLKQDLVKKVDEIETVDDANNFVQDLVQKIDESQFPKEFKEELSAQLNKIAQNLNNADNSINSKDFSNLLEETKNDLSDLTLNFSNQINEIKPIQEDLVNKINNIENENNDLISQIKTILDNDSQIVSDNTDENSDLISQIKNAINIKGPKTTGDIKINSKDDEVESQIDIKEIVNKIDEFISSVSDNNSENNEDLLDLADSLKNINDEFKNNLKEEESLILNAKSVIDNIPKMADINLKPKFNTEVENNTNDAIDSDTLNTISVFKEELSKINIDEIDTQTSDDINKITEAINEFSKAETQDLDDIQDIKKALEDFLNNIDKNQISENNDTQKTINLVEDFNQELNNAINLPKENLIVDANDKTIQNENPLDNTLSFVQNAEEMTSDNSMDFSFSQNSSLKENNNLSNTKISTNEEINVSEENISEILANDEILEDMMISDTISISSESGALSVMDEVAKIALEDTGSINSGSQQGSVIYDSASGKGILLKNINSKAPANLSFQNNISEKIDNSNVLNQITNKIEQAKDGSQKLTLVLRPNDLGRLSIELNSSKDGLTTNILAQNEDVRKYIEKNITGLRQQLSDAGVSVNSIQIKTAGQEGSTSYDGNQGFEKQEQGNNNSTNQNTNQENHKRNEGQYIANMFGYDMHQARDFSGVMNNVLNYNLN